MREVLDHLLRLFAATIRFPPDEATASMIRLAQRRLVVLHHRHRRLDHPYVVAFVGLSNVGKSTLLNALLGEEFAPAGNYPCTALPVEFSYGPEYLCRTIADGDYRDREYKCSSPEQLLSRLKRLADEKHLESTSRLERIDVVLPLDCLKSGLIIADTPGFGAVQLANSDSVHQVVLERFLRERASQVMWIVRASCNIDRKEKDFFDTKLRDVCDDLIVTGSESLSSPDRERWQRRVESVLDDVTLRTSFVSGKRGLAARVARDHDEIDRSGIPALAKRLEQLQSREGRETRIAAAMVDLADQLGRWLRRHRRECNQCRHHVWAPPEWEALCRLGQQVSCAQRVRVSLEAEER